jgi:hypothetical protein
MPGTPQELVALIAAWPEDSLIPPIGHRWADGSTITDDERNDLVALRAYHRHLRDLERRKPAQAKARRLLRGLLSREQRRQLARLRYFYAIAPSGHVYRLDPRAGHVERVERHGRRWFAKESYCLHDDPDENKMPPADVTIAHLLWLLADESAFLATANARRRDDQLWNRAYLQRFRRVRTPS